MGTDGDLSTISKLRNDRNSNPKRLDRDSSMTASGEGYSSCRRKTIYLDLRAWF